MYAWKFMGSYKWGYKSPNVGYNYSPLLITPLLTTHEPPSRLCLYPPFLPVRTITHYGMAIHRDPAKESL